MKWHLERAALRLARRLILWARGSSPHTMKFEESCDDISGKIGLLLSIYYRPRRPGVGLLDRRQHGD